MSNNNGFHYYRFDVMMMKEMHDEALNSSRREKVKLHLRYQEESSSYPFEVFFFFFKSLKFKYRFTLFSFFDDRVQTFLEKDIKINRSIFQTSRTKRKKKIFVFAKRKLISGYKK